LEGERLRGFLRASEEENRVVLGLNQPATAIVHFLIALQLDPAAVELFLGNSMRSFLDGSGAPTIVPSGKQLLM